LVAVAISVTTTGQSDEIETTISAIRSVTNRPIIIGGKGIDAAAALGLGADAYAGTAEDAIAALEDILDRD
jgi:methanogenic corrinoid protein MtbC1